MREYYKEIKRHCLNHVNGANIHDTIGLLSQLTGSAYLFGKTKNEERAAYAYNRLINGREKVFERFGIYVNIDDLVEDLKQKEEA